MGRWYVVVEPARSSGVARQGVHRWSPVGLRGLVLVVVCGLFLSCRSQSSSSSTIATATEPANDPPVAAKSPKLIEAHDMLADLPFCEVRHRGIAIDPGSNWSDAYRGYHFGPFGDVEAATRAGSSAGRVKTRKLVYHFWVDRPVQGSYVAFRAQGEAANALALELDGKRVASLQISRETSAVHTVGPIETTLAAGRRALTFKFLGGARAAQKPAALLDWVRIYVPDNGSGSYLPPVARNLVQDVVLDDVPRRALAMRAPSDVRCSVHVTPDLRVAVDVGYWGIGEGVAQVRALTADNRTIVLAERKLVGGDDSKWTILDLALDAFSGQFVAIEFASVQGDGGGRVVFGEPRLLRDRGVPTPVSAQNVVLVVAGGTHRRLFPPWEGRQGRAALFELVSKGAVFEGYRTDSTLVSSVVASLLTALPPSVHNMLDLGARLPDSASLISEALHEGGGRSAFFTNVPYTFKSFNLNRGWNTFEQLSPVEDRPASEPFTLGSKWLQEDIAREEEGKRLLVLHVRGGHPPWDVTTAEAQLLPPKEYNGIIDPRKGAMELRDVRNRRQRSRQRLGPADLVRMHALQDLALQKQDAGLAQVLRVLTDTGQLDRTLIVFVGDVGMGDPPGVPFVPEGKLQSSRLMPPLIVKFPNDAFAGKRTIVPVSPEALARSLYSAMGLKLKPALAGATLTELLEHGAGVHGGEVLARQGNRFAYFAGAWRLRGTLGEVPGLCNVEVDPTCQTDLLASELHIGHWMWRNALRTYAEQQSLGRLPREAAELDDFTRSALTVYGL